MKLISIKAWALGLLLLAGGANVARAQFVGDVFFLTPSIVVAAGETGQLDFAFFSGDKPLGAATATVSFDPAKLEVVSVEAVAGGAVTPTIRWSVAAGALKIVAVNGQSLAAPIGSVVLARIGIRPIAAAGEQTSLTSTIAAAYATDRSSIAAGNGFGAEVSIGTAIASNSSAREQRASVGSATGFSAEQRARALRPLGHRVTLYEPVGAARFRNVVVDTADPAAPRETAGASPVAQ